MGYYTKYSLEIIENNSQLSDVEIIENLRNTNIYAEEAIDDCGDFGDEMTWYRCEEDMLNFSKEYSNTLFLLNGVGEEIRDIWKSYFKNGKTFTTRAKLVFEEYDESKLK